MDNHNISNSISHSSNHIDRNRWKALTTVISTISMIPKSLLLSILILLICTIGMVGQSNINGQIQPTPTAPSGSCNNNQMKLKTPDGTIYTCQSGTWGVLGGGSGLPAGSVVTGPNLALPGNLSVGATVLVPATCDGTTDNRSVIQAALDSGASHVMIAQAGTCAISAGLTIYSGQWLDLGPATKIAWTAGATTNNLIANRAASVSARTITDAAMNSGSATLSSATGAFTIADVGRTVVVDNAWNSTYGFPLTAEIATITSGTAVGLTRAAGSTVSAQSASLFDRDSNIRVTGGIWDRRSSTAAGPLQHIMRFRHIDGLTVSDVSTASTAGGYAISFADVTLADFSGIRLNNSSSGVQGSGPLSRVSIRNVSGTVGDDAASIIANDWVPYKDSAGPASDITIENINVACVANAVALMGGTANSTLRRITVKNVNNSIGNGVNLREDPSADHTLSGGTTDADEILIDGVKADYAAALTAVVLQSAAGKGIIIRNVQASQSAAAALTGVFQVSGSWSSIVIDGLRANFIHASATGNAIRINGTVDALMVSGMKLTSTVLTQSGISLAATAVLNYFFVTNSHLTKGSDLLVTNSGTAFSRGAVSNTVLDGTARFADLYSTSDISISGVVLNTAYSAVYVGAGAAIVRGSGINNLAGLTGFQRSGAQGLYSYNADWPADAAILVAVQGGRAYNTNAALGCGVGPVISDGATWKNLFTGTGC